MTVKFLQNGIKTEDGQYIPVYYSIGNDLRTITVYARQYGHRLPADIGDIENETDTQVDYFETDHVSIGPGNPYWFAAYAAHKQRGLAYLKRRLTAAKKRLTQYEENTCCYDGCKREIEELKAEMARFAK